MRIALALKKRKAEWRGAVIVDNEFHDAIVEPSTDESSLADLVAIQIGPYLTFDFADGQEIEIVVVLKGKETRPA